MDVNTPTAAREPETPASIEQEELRGISRSVAEIEWLLLVLVLLYYAFGGMADEDKPSVATSMVLYAGFVMGFRYARFFKAESRWKLAVETWVMTAFVTWAIWLTGRLESPLLNSYLLVIITAALALGKATTLLELALIGACFIFLGGYLDIEQLLSLKHAGALFAQFAPFVLVAYITTMFSSDIRYGLNKARMLAETDELTGALNRRGFAIVAGRLFGQAQRYSRPLSMLAIDCDNLKQVNDVHGHQAGDLLLSCMVRTILAQLRHTDVLARIGGDEFVVLLPETPTAGALDVAERIRAAIASEPIVIDKGRVSTSVISVGLATFPHDGLTMDALVAHADRAMYAAKEGGRNRVATASATNA